LGGGTDGGSGRRLGIAASDVDDAVAILSAAGFAAKKIEWTVRFRGSSKVSIQLRTAEIYQSFPDRAVAADVQGILLRAASLEDTLTGKLLSQGDSLRHQSKRIKDLPDLVRLVESHPELWLKLPAELQRKINRP
jgi:hypothetical protein